MQQDEFTRYDEFNPRAPEVLVYEELGCYDEQNGTKEMLFTPEIAEEDAATFEQVKEKKQEDAEREQQLKRQQQQHRQQQTSQMAAQFTAMTVATVATVTVASVTSEGAFLPQLNSIATSAISYVQEQWEQANAHSDRIGGMELQQLMEVLASPLASQTQGLPGATQTPSPTTPQGGASPTITLPPPPPIVEPPPPIVEPPPPPIVEPTLPPTPTPTTTPHTHSYDAGVVVTPATCGANGSKEYTCTGCGDKRSEAIPKLAHIYGAWTKTVGDSINHSHSCTNVGCTVSETAPHNFVSGVCSDCSFKMYEFAFTMSQLGKLSLTRTDVNADLIGTFTTSWVPNDSSDLLTFSATIEEINGTATTPTITVIPNKPNSVQVAVNSPSLAGGKGFGITIKANYDGKTVETRRYSFGYLVTDQLEYQMEPPQIN